MAEKVIIKSVFKKEYQGKEFLNVSLEDGRGGSSYDLELTNLVGQEVELEIKDSGKEYQGNKQYYFSTIKQKKAGAFPKKDYTVEKKIAALNAASRYQALCSVEETIAKAIKYLEWLNK